MSKNGPSILPTAGAAMLVIAVLAVSAPTFAAESPGQEAFMANKCNLCHSVEAASIERTSTSDKMMAMDLSKAGDDVDVEWIVKFLKKEVEREGEPHKKTFKGTDEEAQQIAEWLVTLKSEG